MSEDPWIVIPNWDKFQHGRKREHPWIKDHLTQLHKDEYRNLSMHLRGVLQGIRLAYAASNRQLRGNTLTLTRQLGGRVSTRDLKALSDAGFIELCASNVLAQRQKRETESSFLLKAERERAVSSASKEDTREVPNDLIVHVLELEGADETSIPVLTSYANRGLPEAAFRTAYEVTTEAIAAGRLQGTPIAYYVGCLRAMLAAGQYHH